MDKTKIKKTFEFIGIITVTLAVVSIVILISKGVCMAIEFIKDPVPIQSEYYLTVPRTEIPKPIKCDEPVKEAKPVSFLKSRILAEFEKNGINPTVADCVIQGESGWREKIFSPDGRDGGLMQWRDIHIKSGYLTEECRLNAGCAASKAIETILKERNWGKWNAYKNNNCGRFGKTFI